MNKIEEVLGLSPGTISKNLVDIGVNLAIAIAILIIGFWMANMLSKGIRRVMQRRESDANLTSFISSLVAGLIKTLIIVTAITQLGIEMTSFVAILGAAGLAIGMAFSGTLSNFAGGVMILMFKPFRSGDLVKIQGEEGVVNEVSIFNTYLRTLDNKVIILPNGPVANGTIINYTKADKRRVDWKFSIAYGDDLKVAKELLNKFIQEDQRILKDPESFIGLGSLSDSSVDITVRAWTKTETYWDVFFAMNERVYEEFSTAGLSIPYPQMDIHLRQNE